MLKIYQKTILREVHSDGVIYYVDHRTSYVIEDDACAKNEVNEYNLYDDNIRSVISFCDYRDRKRGRVVYFYDIDGSLLSFKSWREQNAKVVEFIDYENKSCSMNELCRLPADKVIAYLKQEGLNFTLTN